MTHVAICIPSCGTYESGTALALAALCVHSSRSGIDLSLCGWETASVALSRNTLVERSLGLGGRPVDYLLWIDSDVTFPPDGLTRLLKHGKEIVAADYPRRTPPHDFTGRPHEHGSQPQGGLVKFQWVPSGFCLVEAAIYTSPKLKSPWYYETYAGKDGAQGMGEDINFCLDLWHAGFEVWCDIDLSREMAHIGRIPIMAGRAT